MAARDRVGGEGAAELVRDPNAQDVTPRRERIAKPLGKRGTRQRIAAGATLPALHHAIAWDLEDPEAITPPSGEPPTRGAHPSP